MGVSRRTYNLDDSLLRLVDTAQSTHKDNWCVTKEQLVVHALRVVTHQLASKDPQTRMRMESIGETIDPRVDKECFGGLCICCKYHSQCKLGLHADGFEPKDYR